MRKTNRKIHGALGFALVAGLVFCFFAAAVHAADNGIEPYVGFKTELNTGQSIIFNMNKYKSMNATIAKVVGSGTGLATFQFHGTKAGDNNVFELLKTKDTDKRGIGFDTSNKWQNPGSGCKGGTCPRVKYTCTKHRVTLEVMAVSR